MSAMICHHCGRDYFTDYWMATDPGDRPKPTRPGDLYVCDLCCRDTNPEAGPSRWKRSTRDTAAVTVPVYDVRRQCACGTEWMGKAFNRSTDGEVRPGMCVACMEVDDAKLSAMMQRTEVTPRDTELEPPRRVQETNEDQGYPMRPRLVNEID